MRAALDGVWGVWANTDGFTVGEARETHAGMRIFEIAKSVKSVRHFVWSNLDYALKVRQRFTRAYMRLPANEICLQKGGYDPKYKCEHYDGKGRVADWLKAQPSVVNDNDMSWAVVTSGPYIEMLTFVSPLRTTYRVTYSNYLAMNRSTCLAPSVNAQMGPSCSRPRSATATSA